MPKPSGSSVPPKREGWPPSLRKWLERSMHGLGPSDTAISQEELKKLIQKVLDKVWEIDWDAQPIHKPSQLDLTLKSLLDLSIVSTNALKPKIGSIATSQSKIGQVAHSLVGLTDKSRTGQSGGSGSQSGHLGQAGTQSGEYTGHSGQAKTQSNGYPGHVSRAGTSSNGYPDHSGQVGTQLGGYPDHLGQAGTSSNGYPSHLGQNVGQSGRLGQPGTTQSGGYQSQMGQVGQYNHYLGQSGGYLEQSNHLGQTGHLGQTDQLGHPGQTGQFEHPGQIGHLGGQPIAPISGYQTGGQQGGGSSGYQMGQSMESSTTNSYQYPPQLNSGQPSSNYQYHLQQPAAAAADGNYQYPPQQSGMSQSTMDSLKLYQQKHAPLYPATNYQYPQQPMAQQSMEGQANDYRQPYQRQEEYHAPPPPLSQPAYPQYYATAHFAPPPQQWTTTVMAKPQVISTPSLFSRQVDYNRSEPTPSPPVPQRPPPREEFISLPSNKSVSQHPPPREEFISLPSKLSTPQRSAPPPQTEIISLPSKSATAFPPPSKLATAFPPPSKSATAFPPPAPVRRENESSPTALVGKRGRWDQGPPAVVPATAPFRMQSPAPIQTPPPPTDDTDALIDEAVGKLVQFISKLPGKKLNVTNVQPFYQAHPEMQSVIKGKLRTVVARKQSGLVWNGNFICLAGGKKKSWVKSSSSDSESESEASSSPDEASTKMRTLKEKNTARFQNDVLLRINETGSERIEKEYKRVNRALQNASTLDDVDWSKITLKGTCTILEKPFFRLTTTPDASTVRPEPVLKQALDMILQRLRVEGRVVYSWSSDQLKSIRQDLSVQHIKNDFTVLAYEAHARAAIEYGGPDYQEFNQSVTQLRVLYDSGLGTPQAKEEFAAYALLYHVYAKSRYHASANKIALALIHVRGKSEMESTAYAVYVAISANDFVKFFRFVRTFPGLGRLLLNPLVPLMRLRCIRSCAKAAMGGKVLSLSFVKRMCGFVGAAGETGESDASSEWIQFCERFKLNVSFQGEVVADAKTIHGLVSDVLDGNGKAIWE